MYKLFLSFICVVFFIAFPSLANAGQSGIVAEYGLNESTGATITDTSGNNNTGTITGATRVAGKYGSALNFNGTSQYVTISDANSLDLTSGMTLEAWIKPSLNSSWRTVILKENTKSLVYGLYSYSGFNKPLGQINNGAKHEVRGTAALPLNAWSHVSVTYDNANLRFYLNGVLKATTATTGNITSSAGPLKIGGNTIWGEYFKGDLDEIRVYNRALSALEITTDMNTAVVSSPKLIILSPTSGQSISGTTVNVAYTTSGDLVGSEVNHAHFRLDGGSTKMDLDFDGFYAFTDVTAGNHTLLGILAKADHTEIAGSDFTVNFSTTTPDTIAPTVSITSPTDGSAVSGTLNVTVNAADNVGVSGVQFKVDGANIGAEDTVSPYSVSWNTATIGNGSHTLTAIARDSSANTAVSTININVSNSNASDQIGQWGPVMNWPMVAVHTSLLNNGKVLVWDAWNDDADARLWDPTTNVFTSVPNPAGFFCSGHTSLADGRMLVMGGWNSSGIGPIGIDHSVIFDQITNEWIPAPNMAYPRWYPSATKLSDGRVLTIGGLATGNRWAKNPEIYDPATNTWTKLEGTVDYSNEQDNEYPLSFLLPSSKIFTLAAVSRHSYLLNVSGASLTNFGTLPIALGSAAQYRPGKIMYAGGGDFKESLNPSSKQVSVIDFNQATPTWRNITPMKNGRYEFNLTISADGKVYAIGGASIVSQATTNGTTTLEMWDPDTETWTTMASMIDKRMYHSTSLLLPDGKILSSGGGRYSSGQDYLTAQLYSPPYLFKGARPTITNAPDAVNYGQTVTIDTPDAQNISKVSFIPLGSNTHTLDMNQAYIELPFTKNTGNISVTVPTDSNIAPPGYFMMFIFNSSGVPSIAKIMNLNTLPVSDPPMTVTFNDTVGQNIVLNGQYPTGVIDWGTDKWWLSSPWNLFTTKSVTFNGGTIKTASFNFLTPKILVSLQTYNGGSADSAITISCSGNPTVNTTAVKSVITNINTNWTTNCSTVTISSSNGWNTNFDNLVIQ